MKSLKVKDYMAKKLVTLQQRTNVVEAMAVLLDKGISGVPVVDDDGQLVGVLSEVDIMQIIVQDSYYDESMGIVGDYMRTPVDTVSSELDIYSVAEMFIDQKRRRFPVVNNDGKLVGQISRRDVLRAMETFLQHKG